MASFRVLEHVLPCQHIRGHPHATRNEQEVELKLCIKQYVPLSNPDPQKGDVTIIAAGGCGLPKEVYEPLWDHLLDLSKKHGFGIRGIWIADIASQGASGILNEYEVGDEPTWADHSRDLLHMINHFRKRMPRPLIGIGHSIGPGFLVHLSIMHPRLLSTLILIESVMSPDHPPGPNFAVPSTFRQDLWPSEAAAEKAIRATSFYKYWDPKALDLYIKYGLRPLPTALFPDASVASDPDSDTLETYSNTENIQSSDDTGPPTNIKPSSLKSDNDKSKTPHSVNPTTSPPHDVQTPTSTTSTPVTLTTTRHQAAWTTMGSNFTPYPSRTDALIWADINHSSRTHFLMHQPGSILTHALLPTLRPSVLYIFGAKSAASTPERITKKMCTTGTGVGGSGGACAGKVEKRVFQGRGHFLPLERGGVDVIGEDCAEWIGRRLREVREEDRWWEGYRGRSGRSEGGEGWRVGERWMEAVRGKADARREGAPMKKGEWRARAKL